MGLAQDVTVRPSLALSVLHQLVGQLVGILLRVPLANRGAKTTTPATELLEVADELEEMRAGANHLVDLLTGVLLGLRLAHLTGDRQSEERGVLLESTAGEADLDDLVDQLLVQEGSLGELDHHVGVLSGQFVLADVERATGRPHDEETAKLSDRGDLEHVAA